MGNRAYALLTGLFVIVLGFAIFVIAWWLAGVPAERVPYEVVSREEVTGLNESSQLLYRGVPAGRVERIRFNPDDFREILIRVAVDEVIPVTRGTYATLRVRGVTGLVQLVLHDEGDDPELLPTSTEEPGRIPMKAGLVDRLTDQGEAVLGNVESLTENLAKLLDEENVRLIGGILHNMEAATAGFEDLDQQLEPFFAVLPQVADETVRLLQDLQTLTAGMQTIPPELTALIDDARALMEIGQRIGEDLERTAAPELERTLRELAETGRELQRLARQLADQPESLFRGPRQPPPGPGEPGYQEN